MPRWRRKLLYHAKVRKQMLYTGYILNVYIIKLLFIEKFLEVFSKIYFEFLKKNLSDISDFSNDFRIDLMFL